MKKTTQSRVSVLVKISTCCITTMQCSRTINFALSVIAVKQYYVSVLEQECIALMQVGPVTVRIRTLNNSSVSVFIPLSF